MKYFMFPFFIIIIGISSAFTQTIAPDFTLENTQGVSYSLYNELNAGKSVLLCFFSVSCGSCADEVPLIQEIYNNNDSAKFTLMAIDSYLATNEAIEEFISFYSGNYTGFSTYSNNIVLSDSMFNIEYFPQNFVVCPDKSFKKSSIDNVQIILDNCPTNAANINKLETSDNKIIYVSASDEIYLKYYCEKESNIDFEIIDLLGNIKMKKNYNSIVGENQVLFNRNGIQAGYYLIKMIKDGILTDVKKVVVL